MESLLAGIHVIPLPTPFPVGEINVYFLEGDEPTLIDAGPSTQEAYHTLKERLAALKYTIKDIKKIILTHWHLDHSGLAKRIANESGAKIYIHRLDNEKVNEKALDVLVENFGLVKEYFKESGLSNEFANSFFGYIDMLFKNYLETFCCANLLDGGEELEIGGKIFYVIHTPGHTIGHISLYDKEKKLLFSGDHILKHITPNPVMDLVNKKKYGFKSLISYVDTLSKMRDMDVKLVLPGHGDFVYDLKEKIDEIMYHHQLRKQTLLDLLTQGKKTRATLSSELFGTLDEMQIYLGLSEVEGHLEILEREGKVEKERDGELIYYFAT